ncbi:MAG: hypothetical protein AAF914_10150 [Pseudomonadota bacterium]
MRFCVFLGAVMALGLTALFSPRANADGPAPMVFSLVEHDGATVVVAEGRIDANSAARLRALLDTAGTAPRAIHLTSPGGRLDGGLALGRAIREAGLAARVGSPQSHGAPSDPSLCASACAYAFLGGVDRRVGAAAVIGFHDIYPAAGQGTIAPERLAAATGAAMVRLRAYVAEMGAHPNLPDLAVEAGRDRLFVPRGLHLWQLGIETSPDMALVTGGDFGGADRL